jgi:thiol-disulfide isomerase/thioredoxin
MKKLLTIGLVIGLSAGAGVALYYQMIKPAYAAESPADTKKGPVTTLPDFSLINREGKQQSIKSWPGKSLVINFWATWCGPCRKEIPLLKDIAAKQTAAGFQVVGIAIDFQDEVVKYADQIQINYPILIGEKAGLAAADAFGVDGGGLPFTVFTDSKGRLVTIYTGELTKPRIDVILGGVTRVNKGELTPEAARVAIATQLKKLPKTGA